MKRFLLVGAAVLALSCAQQTTAMAQEGHEEPRVDGSGGGGGNGRGRGRSDGQGSEEKAGGGGSGGHSGGHHAPHVEFWKSDMNAPPIGWLAFDFLLFVVLLVRFGGKPLSNHLVQRHNEVRKAIEEAAAAKADAEKKAREYEERIKRLDAEIETLKAEFRASGEAARKRLGEAGEKTAERILKDTVQQIAAEETRAKEALQQEAAKLALQLAEEIVRKNLKADDHKRLSQDFVRELGA